MTGHVNVTAESAKELMTRLQDLGIAAKITVDADGRFKVAPADGKHTCHWPCAAQIFRDAAERQSREHCGMMGGCWGFREFCSIC